MDAGARAGPGPSTPGPSRADGDAVFKRPGPLSSKRKARSTTILDLTGESSSGDVSEDSDITPFSDMSSDTNRMLTQKTGQPKMGRGRPPTTGEWVGVEGVRRELELLKQEHEKVLAERDVLAWRFEASFGATAGKIPSADDGGVHR